MKAGAPTRRKHAADLCLAGSIVRVFWIPGLELDGEPCEGLWDPETSEIHLDTSLWHTRAKLQEVLIHECAHAISDNRNLRLSESACLTLGLDLQQMLAPFLRRLF